MSWRAEHVETLPDGTERYELVRTAPRRKRVRKYGAIPHECPHCGGLIYYRFVETRSGKRAVILDHKREEEQ